MTWPTVEWTDAEREAVRLAWHRAYEWQYDECDHGTYSGGPTHGQPYEMCQIQAGRIIDALGPIIADRLAAARPAIEREAIRRYIEQKETRIRDAVQAELDRIEREGLDRTEAERKDNR